MTHDTWHIAYDNLTTSESVALGLPIELELLYSLQIGQFNMLSPVNQRLCCFTVELFVFGSPRNQKKIRLKMLTGLIYVH